MTHLRIEVRDESLHISNRIQLHPALRNSVLTLPVLRPLRPIPVVPDGPQPPDDFFPGVVFAPMLQCLACSCSQNPARAPRGSGGRALPTVLRVLLGSTSDILSR